MAVYTQVSTDELKAFWAGYDLPALTGHAGISEGTANSNYRIETEAGPYILTLYEKRTNTDDLPFFLGLMSHLAARGIVCPAVMPARDGQLARSLCGRLAAVTSFLEGRSVARPQPVHCGELGRALASLHLAGRDFPLQRPNPLSLESWQRQTAEFAAPAETLEPGLGRALEREMEALTALWPRDLPGGVIHADLFTDNVFFTGDRLTGIIDFYYACTDSWIYDLAVCLNAWCFEDRISFNITKARALLRGYNAVRPFGAAEMAALPILCRGAAMNFTLMRLGLWFDAHPYRERDPRDYFKRLQFHQQVQGVGEYGLELAG